MKIIKIHTKEQIIIKTTKKKSLSLHYRINTITNETMNNRFDVVFPHIELVRIVCGLIVGAHH